MANTAQLLRRQSSRDIILKTQKSIDQHELRVSKQKSNPSIFSFFGPSMRLYGRETIH